MNSKKKCQKSRFSVKGGNSGSDISKYINQKKRKKKKQICIFLLVTKKEKTKQVSTEFRSFEAPFLNFTLPICPNHMLSFSLTPSLAFLFLQYFGSYHCEQKSEELIKIKQQMVLEPFILWRSPLIFLHISRHSTDSCSDSCSFAFFHYS